MRINELIERLEAWKASVGNVEIALHVRTNDPTLSKASIEGVINESVRAVEYSTGKEIIEKRIVLFGGKPPWMKK